MDQLVECVPNFSEGRDRAVIDAIAAAIAGVADVKLLEVDPGADTNRTVYTFVGTPGGVAEAAVRGAAKAVELIDMARHKGAHPRMGALDVCPFVPVRNVSMDECVAIAHAVGGRMADELGVPVYFYEHAATSETRRSLADVRAGEYEGLEQKLADPAWAPDRGPSRFNPRSGAFIVGAREFLIAYNVNVNTRERRLANEIALTIRENGRLKRDAAGQVVNDSAGVPLRVPGRLKAVRAIGWYIEQYRQAQVSINLLDFRTTPLHEVFDVVCDEAAKLGLRVTGSELVGLIPLEPLLAAGRHYLVKQGRSPGVPESELVETAVRTLGLDQLGPFDPQTKVIEYHFSAAGRFARLSVTAFADEVSAGTPTPGGGSVAALAGALAAALAAMVANLTVGKKGYEGVWGELGTLAEKAQALKDRLIACIDEDSAAFDLVLEANRLPKGTSEQQAARAAALERANRRASEVPLETARLALDALTLVERVARCGSSSSICDAGVAALMARAAVEGAALNVRTNLSGIADAAYTARARQETGELVSRAGALAQQTLQAVSAAVE